MDFEVASFFGNGGCHNGLPSVERVSSASTEIEKSQMNIKDRICISLLKLFHGIIVRRDKTYVVSKMTLGRRGAGGLFPFSKTFDEFLHSDTWLKGLNFLVGVRKEEIDKAIWMWRRVAIESVGMGRRCGRPIK